MTRLALRSTRTTALSALLCALLVTGGCLSHEHQIRKDELERIVSLPPQARGASVRVVQSIGNRRGDPVVPTMPPPPPPGYDPGPGVYVDPAFHVSGHIGGGHAHHAHGSASPTQGWRAPPPTSGSPATGWHGGSATAPPAGAPAPAPTAPVPSTSPAEGWRGGAAGAGTAAPRSVVQGGGPSAGWKGVAASGADASVKSSSSDDLKVLAVIAILAAAFAGFALAGTEGMRYDGTVAMHPDQPVHLKRAEDGRERVVPLSALAPEHLGDIEGAYVADDEAGGLYLLGRAPLDRKGFAFKLELGVGRTTLDDFNVSGFASHLQVGYFPHRLIGLLGSVTFGGGTDAYTRDFFQNSMAVETQLFAPGLGRLHLGGFGRVGRGYTSVEDDVRREGLETGLGAILEIELTTRMALTGRVGWSFARVGSGWESSGTTYTAGIAIY